jgi:hypothetical protein
VSGGDIAGLIAAGVFAVLVGLLAVPLVKLGRVFDETSETIREVRDSATPVLTELSSTLTEANKQLVRVDAITSSVEEATANLTSLVALFSATLGGPLIKIAGFSAGVRAAIAGARPKKGRAAAKK